ncbi:MAG: thiamine pyrophosphate-binding protein [Sandaracinaceae bacterium]|nr:thiamine pyrophosphate-binding protein [Sandaracinaceae bacterium]
MRSSAVRTGPSEGSPQTAPTALTRCADVVVEALVRAGVDVFIGVPGGAISPVYDALVERDDVRVVHARHETTAMFMAIGHARMRPGSLPCVLTTSGPGVTNALTGVAAAFGEGVPVLVLGGEVPTSKFGRGALQEGTAEAIDVVGMMRSVTRVAQPMTLAMRAPFQIAAAARAARSGRPGPVFLSLPLDVAVTPIPASYALVEEPEPPRVPSAEAIERAAELLARANRPLLLAGSGARGAANELAALARHLGAPVITSPKAKGVVDEGAGLCLGVFGYGGHPSALEWLQAEPPDVVLAVGCGLNEVSTNSWSSLVAGTRAFVQIDLDPEQFGRNYRTDLALLGDARATLAALATQLPGAPRPVRSYTVRRYEPEREEDDSVPLAPARALAVLQAAMPPDTVYTVDIGEHLLFAIHYLRVAAPDGFITSVALGSMGSGIGAAVGAKLARPERPVVAICGDYGFQMYGMDLNTCVQERLGVVFFVMNDHRMRMVEAGIDRIYGRGLRMDGPVVDFAVAARAHGAHGALATSAEELRRALEGRAPDVPLVVDVRIDPGAGFPVNARVAEISNFASE